MDTPPDHARRLGGVPGGHAVTGLDPEASAALVGDLSEWVEALPGYQRGPIEQLLAASGPVDVAVTWLSTTGPKDTAPYGGVRAGASRFYDNLLAEMQKLICGTDAVYDEERKQLKAATSGGKLLVVGAISTAIAPHVGAAAAVLGPAIALTLGVIGRAGQASICETLAEVIEQRSEAIDEHADNI